MSTARSAAFAEAAERPNSQLYDRRKVLPFRNSKQPRHDNFVAVNVSS
jgi:hypothetical protein